MDGQLPKLPLLMREIDGSWWENSERRSGDGGAAAVVEVRWRWWWGEVDMGGGVI